MAPEPTQETFLQPTSVEAALSALKAHGPEAVLLAGGTWVMRAPLRHEPWPRPMVSLNRIKKLHDLALDSAHVRIGPLVTHDRLAQALRDAPDLNGLAAAASQSANPAVRRMATIGGNLCAQGFAAADLVPALLAADAFLEISTATSTETLSVADFLNGRARRCTPWLAAGLQIARSHRLSAHARLTMRRAGDYPCAIVSLSLAIDARGRIEDARIAVGSVELVARRWHTLERALDGSEVVPTQIETIAAGLTGEFTPRDATDAPGWYRLSVLPVLVRRAIQTIQPQLKEIST